MCKKVNFKAFLSEKKNHYFFMIWIKCAKLLISKDVSPVRLLLCEAKTPCFKYFFLNLNLDSIIHCYNTLFDHRIRTDGERITICFIPCIFMLFSCKELYSCKVRCMITIQSYMYGAAQRSELAEIQTQILWQMKQKKILTEWCC